MRTTFCLLVKRVYWCRCTIKCSVFGWVEKLKPLDFGWHACVPSATVRWAWRFRIGIGKRIMTSSLRQLDEHVIYDRILEKLLTSLSKDANVMPTSRKFNEDPYELYTRVRRQGRAMFEIRTCGTKATWNETWRHPNRMKCFNFGFLDQMLIFPGATCSEHWSISNYRSVS